MFHNKQNYKVYLFKENDNINIIFDKYDLVDTLTELYRKIGVVNRINTEYEVTEDEKNIIMSLIGEDMNIQCTDDDQTIKTIGNIISTTKVLHSLISEVKTISQEGTKKNVSNVFTNVSEVKSAILRSQISTTQSELASYFSQASINHDTINKTNFDDIEGFGDNGQYSYLVNEVLKEFDEKLKKSYYVLYNDVYEAVLICVKTESIAKCVKEFKDFKLIREYDDLMDVTFNKIEEYFSKNVYCTEEMLIKKLDAFESLYDIDKKCPLEKEKRLILYYINSNYIVSKNVDKRIKVSTLLENVQKELKIKDMNLKYRFASILAEIGLQKKRYSDGMYIYGIEPKSELKIVDKDYIRHLTILNLVEKRKQELQNV